METVRFAVPVAILGILTIEMFITLTWPLEWAKV